MATEEFDIKDPETGKKRTIVLDVPANTSDEMAKKMLKDHLDKQDFKEKKSSGLLKGTLPVGEWNKIENEGFLPSAWNAVKAPYETVKSLTREEEYPFQNLSEMGQALPGALYKGISDPVLKAMAGNYGGAAGDIGGALALGGLGKLASSPRALTGVGRGAATMGKELISPQTGLAALGGSPVGGVVGRAFGLPWAEGAGLGAAAGMAMRSKPIIQAGMEGYRSAYNVPKTWGEMIPTIPPETPFNPQPQIAAPGAAPRSGGGIPMPAPETGFTGPVQPPIGRPPVQQTGPPQIWGPSAGLNASTEGAFQFPQRQIAAGGAPPISQGATVLPGAVQQSPRYMPGAVPETIAPQAGVVPQPGVVSPLNLLDKIKELGLGKDLAGEVPDAGVPTMKPVRAPASSKAQPRPKPQAKSKTPATESKSEAKPQTPKPPKEKVNEPIPESKTTETTNTGQETSTSQAPQTPQVLTVDFVEREAANLGIPYKDVRKHLVDQGYRIIHEKDLQKFGARVGPYRMGP